MYIPKAFKMSDENELYALMEKYSFATLHSLSAGIPVATHLPLLVDQERKCLYGHFAKSNSQWEEIVGQTVLVVFQGPHCYISPSWFESQNDVPTWNYTAVHAYGEIELLESNNTQLIEQFESLVRKYEAPSSEYSLAMVEEKYMSELHKGIQGFKLIISTLEGKAKLSQNETMERNQLIIAQLQQSPDENDRDIARLMELQLMKINEE